LKIAKVFEKDPATEVIGGTSPPCSPSIDTGTPVYRGVLAGALEADVEAIGEIDDKGSSFIA